MLLIKRSGWGARSPEYINHATLSAESTCHWNGPKITVSGKPTWDHSKCFSLVRGIQNFHMDGRGWSDIAYNFVICPHGYIFEGRGFNTINGANGTNSGNRSSHAVMCLAGEENPFPESEKIGFKECIKYILDNTLAPNTCKGHRDHKSTECPGDVRYEWVHSGMPVSQLPEPPAPQPPVMKGDNMIKIVWFRGEPTEPGNQPNVSAAYEVLYATSAFGNQVAVEATWINDIPLLNVKRFVFGGVEDQTRQNPNTLAEAGTRFYGGPYKTH